MRTCHMVAARKKTAILDTGQFIGMSKQRMVTPKNKVRRGEELFKNDQKYHFL